MSASAPFPTRYELKCSGIAMMTAQTLWILFWVIFAVLDPKWHGMKDPYKVRSDEEVIALHAHLSSPEYRTYVECGAGLSWICFPLYLFALYGIKKVYLAIFVDSRMEICVYVLEKAYLLALVVVQIIAPALCLVMASFEWTFDEHTSDPDVVPTGYYMQLYALVLLEELYDSVCIADGLFLFLVSVVPQFRYCATAERFAILKQHRCHRTSCHVLIACLATSMAIAYLVSLFRFAEDGFFSLNGAAGWLVVYGFYFKMAIGLRLFVFARSDRYDELKRVFGAKKSGDALTSAPNAGGTGATGAYDMKAVSVEMGKQQATL